MGLDPALSRFTLYMTTLQLKSNHESKLCRDRITAAMSSTTASVTINTNDIVQLKKLAEIEVIALKSYKVAVENEQHNSKVFSLLVEKEFHPLVKKKICSTSSSPQSSRSREFGFTLRTLKQFTAYQIKKYSFHCPQQASRVQL